MSLPTPAEVLDKLAALGSAGQIANHLEQQGVVGAIGNPYTCPIAVYVLRETGVERVGIGNRLWSHGSETQHTPAAVGDFVHRFDCRDFPALVVATDEP